MSEEKLSRRRSLAAVWHELPGLLRVTAGVVCSSFVLVVLWQAVLVPLQWPPLADVGEYLWKSLGNPDSYKAALMTATRALMAMVLGFAAALVLAVLTGRTIVGWLAFFFLLLMVQKIPAIAATHVLVKSTLGIGFLMTVVLASSVVFTNTWLILHHRARTLDPREVFALQVVGVRGWQLALYGLLPHMGSAIGGAARLGMSIALLVTVIGEWQGVWSDASWWQFGLGVEISRSYDAMHSQARVLAWCAWLGVVGALLDGLVQGALWIGRFLTGVELKR